MAPRAGPFSTATVLSDLRPNAGAGDSVTSRPAVGTAPDSTQHPRLPPLTCVTCQAQVCDAHRLPRPLLHRPSRI